MAAPALADKKKTPRGKPFKALLALIEENQALIQANTASIESLNSEVDTLISELADTQANIAALSDQVDSNEAQIAALLAQVASNSSDIVTLEAALTAAIADTVQLRAELETALAQLDTDLRGLISTNSGLIVQINTLIADLQTQVSDNTASINPLTTQVAGLLATVMANTNSITLIQIDNTQLNNELDGLNTSLSTLVTELEVVKNRIQTLESLYDGIEQNDASLADLLVGDTTSGSLESNDERSQSQTCSLNSDSGRGVIDGDCYADYYTLYVAEESTVTIDLGSPDLDGANYGTGNFFDTYLILHTPDDLSGNIAADDDSGNGVNSQITTTLQPGTYVIEVTASNIYNSGANDYQLRVQ
ncbi:hypothetical protein NBRC116188_23230 [Oceaniserpentilla sp. 4NH20-0058]